MSGHGAPRSASGGIAPTSRVGEAFVTAFGDSRVASGATLAPLTTFRTGGTADWFIEARDSAEIVRAVRLSAELGVQVTLLGGGSNVLVGERGIRGLVLRVWHGDVTLAAPGVVRAHGGVTLNGLVRWTVNRGWAGLEGWAGTPGTVGGGLHGNAHFQGELLGTHLLRVCVVDRQGSEHRLSREEMEFGYDASRLQRTGEAILWAEFGVDEAEPAALRARARESLSYRKRNAAVGLAERRLCVSQPRPRRPHAGGCTVFRWRAG